MMMSSVRLRAQCRVRDRRKSVAVSAEYPRHFGCISARKWNGWAPRRCRVQKSTRCSLPSYAAGQADEQGSHIQFVKQHWNTKRFPRQRGSMQFDHDSGAREKMRGGRIGVTPSKHGEQSFVRLLFVDAKGSGDRKN